MSDSCKRILTFVAIFVAIKIVTVFDVVPPESILFLNSGIMLLATYYFQVDTHSI